LTDEQVVELVKQLPPERRRNTLLALAAETQAPRDSRMQLAGDQLRRLCANRGKNWDAMSEDDREAFVDELMHEDRSCGR